MRSAVEAVVDQSIPQSPSSLRWSSPLPSTLPSHHSPQRQSNTKSPSPMETQEMQEKPELEVEQESSGLEPGPSSSSPCGIKSKSPPREAADVSTDADERDRERIDHSFNDGDDSQPSTSRAHLDFVENSIPMQLLKPKLEPLDDESSRDGYIPLETMAHIKTEIGQGRLSEMRSEDSRSEMSNVETKRYRVSFKVCSKAAARLKRILNAQPMALKRLGISGVQVDQSDGMISVAARAKERATEEASRRHEPSHPSSVSTPIPSQPQMRGVPDRNGDANGMMVAGGMGPPQPGYPAQPVQPVPHPVMNQQQQPHMGVPPGHVNIQHQQMVDGPSGSSGTIPPSALPPHMQQQRQPQPPPTNSPILVNLLNSQQPPPPTGRPFSPYAAPYPGGAPVGGSGVPPPTPSQSGQPMDMAAYHHMERQRMMMQQQQQMQQQGVGTPMGTPTTPGSVPGPSGFGFQQRPMYAGQQPGMYPQGHPNTHQRVQYPGQPAMYGAMPQVKQEPGTYNAMPQVKQEPVEATPPPPKKRKKPTKKQQKEAEAAQAAAQAANAQPGPYFPDGRMMHPQQMQGGFPGGAPPHPQYPQGTGPQPPNIPPQYYQQQQQQNLAWQHQQMQHQRMMQQQQQQQAQQQQQMGMGGEYPAGSGPIAGPSTTQWHPHQRPPPVPYPPVQNDGSSGVVSGVTGTGDMGTHSDSNSPVTPFGGHPIMVQQQQHQQQQPGHPSPMYSRDSGGGTPTPTLFPYPSTSYGSSGPSGSSQQSGVNSTPLTPGTTPQTPGGGQQSQQNLSNNEHHDFDDKLFGEGTHDLADLGDLDDIVPMGDLMMGGDNEQSGGDGRVKEEIEEENGESGVGVGGMINTPIKRNGRHDLDMSINSVVDMVAKGGGELSSPTPPSIATPTSGGGGTSAFPATTPTPSSSTAPSTPTLQTPPTTVVRRKNTASSVQQLTAQQRMQQQQQMMGGGGGQYVGQPQSFGMSQGGMHPQGQSQGGIPPSMHGHPHQMNHPSSYGHHPHQQSHSFQSSHRMEQDGRSIHPSHHPSSRGGGRIGGGGGGHLENGRVNGHTEISNGITSREESGKKSDEAAIQAILSKVKAQGMAQEQRAKEQRTNTGAKGRGGGTGTRKKRKVNEIGKERSPKEEDDSFLIGMDVRGPPTMTAGQAAKARMGVQGGGGGIPSGTNYYHQISNQMRPQQPPPVQHKPS